MLKPLFVLPILYYLSVIVLQIALSTVLKYEFFCKNTVNATASVLFPVPISAAALVTVTNF